jgi:hypothetical protein
MERGRLARIECGQVLPPTDKGHGSRGATAVRGNVGARRAVPEARSATSDEKPQIDEKPLIAQVVFTQFPTF